jgi:hypothetical protein
MNIASWITYSLTRAAAPLTTVSLKALAPTLAQRRTALGLVAGLVAGLGLVASQSAIAHGNVSLNIGGVVAPGVYGSVSVGRPYYPPQVAYQQPQIIYQQPQVIYQQPQVVYQAPIVVNQPAYVVRQPAPVLVVPGYSGYHYGHPGRHHGQYRHHHRHGGWY